ncbi:LuxR family transcriptional regulator [Alkalispirochaeta sphaeroplastigenens]|uniref:LuxR family transcriptional regulator n=1 Tax=Alkalispirochaeta sphaeroplastigenens TaxID=1187066 RepID=A0A2S4JLG4_9SPIO|nr:response regulator transcription factor [Alkalispirochaeta sphaeroplastigenens]POR00341.1 LuxR family transcriptional regulator [Alkalispirochaeta sphaeroplastigenens]
MKRSVTFLVVDDHPIFRQGLAALIRKNPMYQDCREAGDIEEAMTVTREYEPDIALIDISLNGKSGFDLVQTFQTSHPRMQQLVISMYDEAVYASMALKAGARGYVMKHEAASVVLGAIQTVLDGRIFLSPTMRERLIDAMFSQSGRADLLPMEQLTVREVEVLVMIGQGYGASEIADLLHISVKTVNVHREKLKQKLQISDANTLRRFAIKWVQSRER